MKTLTQRREVRKGKAEARKANFSKTADMYLKDIIVSLNILKNDGVIGTYATGGAVAATFYLEPIATVDVTVKYDFDLKKMIESKKAYRKKLAALPIAEKLRMLDAMRERELSIRRNPDHPDHKKIENG